MPLNSTLEIATRLEFACTRPTTRPMGTAWVDILDSRLYGEPRTFTCRPAKCSYNTRVSRRAFCRTATRLGKPGAHSARDGPAHMPATERPKLRVPYRHVRIHHDFASNLCPIGTRCLPPVRRSSASQATVLDKARRAPPRGLPAAAYQPRTIRKLDDDLTPSSRRRSSRGVHGFVGSARRHRIRERDALIAATAG